MNVNLKLGTLLQFSFMSQDRYYAYASENRNSVTV